MCSALEELMQQGFEKGIDKNRLDSLRALMKSMGWTLDQAIAALDYPVSDKEKFAAALVG